VVLSNDTLLSNESGSLKERTQTSTERGISCQRNGHWHSPWHWAVGSDQSSVSRLWQGGVPKGVVH